MRPFVHGMIAGGVLGALGVYLLSSESGSMIPENAGEKMDQVARRVKRKSAHIMES